MKSYKKCLLILLCFSIFSFSQNTEDKTLALKVHNNARKDVGVKDLKWSKKLEKEALNYAKLLAKKENKLKHSKKTRNGENLAMFYESVYSLGKKTSLYSATPLYDASIEWYNEIKNYKYSKIKRYRIGPAIGHYTQMIWENTREVGIASAVSRNGKVYVVARYYPRGNYLGERPY